MHRSATQHNATHRPAADATRRIALRLWNGNRNGVYAMRSWHASDVVQQQQRALLLLLVRPCDPMHRGSFVRRFEEVDETLRSNECRWLTETARVAVRIIVDGCEECGSNSTDAACGRCHSAHGTTALHCTVR
jgi:hypothetical protein